MSDCHSNIVLHEPSRALPYVNDLHAKPPITCILYLYFNIAYPHATYYYIMLYHNVYSTCDTLCYNSYFVETVVKTDSLNNDNDNDESGYLLNEIGTIVDNR